MNNFIQHPITEALGWTMIHSLWQITLLVLCYRGLILIPNLRKAPFRYALGMGVLGLALILSCTTFYQVYEPPLVIELAQHSADIATPIESTENSQVGLLLHNEEDGPMNSVEPSFHEKWRALFSQLEPFISPLALGWMLGILFMGMRFGASWMYLRSLRKVGLNSVDSHWEDTFQKWVSQMGIKRAVLLRYSPKVSEPLTLGHFKPLVLIPLGLLSQQDPQQIEALLLHELAHIRRYDFAFNIVQSWVEILFFYHPAIWWISREVRENREHCCDDAAIAVSNNPLAYAQALTQLQLTSFQHSKAQLTMSASGNTSKFSQRIYRIMGQPTQNLGSTKGNLVAILAFLGTFFLAFQQQQFQEEQAMLDTLMENEQVDTNTLQNWLLFTIHPDTDQDEMDSWLGEVSQLSAYPFQMRIETEAQTLKSVTAFKMKDQEEQKLWTISPNSVGAMKKMMLVYDPISDILYMQTNHSNNLFSYDLETDAFAYLDEESLPFGDATKDGIMPMVSFQEQALDRLPADRFTIELTPQTTMDELLGWSTACSKLGMKLEYNHISFDSESGELVKLSGIYQNAVGETMPFNYEEFDFAIFDLNRNSKTIPSALMARVDSSETPSSDEHENDETPLTTFPVHKGSSDQELKQIQLALESYGIKLEWDHILRGRGEQIQEIFGRFIYKNKSYRMVKIDQLNEFAIQVYDRQEDPIQLVLEEKTYGSQILSPKPQKGNPNEGTTHLFTRNINSKKGPEVFQEYGIGRMWYGSSESLFRKEYEEFVKGLFPNSILFINEQRITVKDFLQLQIPVDSVEKFFYRDKTAAAVEFGEEFKNSVYQVLTKNPLAQKSEANSIALQTSVDSPSAPILVLNGEVQEQRSAIFGKVTPEQFQEKLGINPDQIEWINVLKGAAAIKKYGEMAINGVVEIQTKDAIDRKELPLVVLDGKIVEPMDSFEGEDGYYLLNVNKFAKEFNVVVKEAESLGKEEAIEKYGEIGKNGALENWTEKGLSIRGLSQQPLLVVDGVELPGLSLNKEEPRSLVVKPEDIERINVVKGEAADKKYGRKGENGVVEIFTKLPEFIRLKISDYVLPNGRGTATVNHSKKYDDVLILKKWKDIGLSVNGALPEPLNGTLSQKINDLPYKKYQWYQELAEHQIHSIHSEKLNVPEGEKWIRHVYTDRAPGILWRPSATGDYSETYSPTQLFFLNIPGESSQNLSAEVEALVSSSGEAYYVVNILGGNKVRIAQESHRFYKDNLDSRKIRTRILSHKEAIAEFATSGVTGLLVVEFDNSENEDEVTVEGKAELPQNNPEIFPFKSADKGFPISGMGVAPNPTQNGEVDIRLIFEKKKEVRISIFDRLGKEVAFVEEKPFEKGAHTIPWNLDQLPSGYYFVVAQVDGKGMSTPLVIK